MRQAGAIREYREATVGVIGLGLVEARDINPSCLGLRQPRVNIGVRLPDTVDQGEDEDAAVIARRGGDHGRRGDDRPAIGPAPFRAELMNARSVRAIVKALENQRERVDGPIIDLALEFAANRVIDRVSGLGRAEIAIGRTFAAQVFLRIERLKRGRNALIAVAVRLVQWRPLAIGVSLRMRRCRKINAPFGVLILTRGRNRDPG